MIFPIKRKNNEINDSKSFSYYNLLESFKQDGCPICILLQKTIDGYFESLLYENVNDPFVRKEIKNSFGYCKKHSIQIEKVAERSFQDFGLSIIIEDLANTLMHRYKDLNKSVEKQDRRKQPSKVCPVCVYENTFKEIYASDIARCIKDERFFNEFRSGPGLCFNHLIAVKKYITDPSDLKRLLEFQESVLEKTIHDLRNFIKKHDYRNKEPIAVTEAMARKKALRKIVGEF
jgi:hypothetical protein